MDLLFDTRIIIDAHGCLNQEPGGPGLYIPGFGPSSGADGPYFGEGSGFVPSPDGQRLTLLDYAHRQGLTVHTFVEAQVSSRRAAARQGLDTVLEQVHPGDLILVSELSRLGRSVG